VCKFSRVRVTGARFSSGYKIYIVITRVVRKWPKLLKKKNILQFDMFCLLEYYHGFCVNRNIPIYRLAAPKNRVR